MSGVQILSSQSFVLLYFLCFLHVYIFTFCLQICIFYFFCIFGAFLFLYFFILYFYTFCTFVLSHLIGQSIWTSMQNLSYQYFCSYILFCTFCTFAIFWTIHRNFHAKSGASSFFRPWLFCSQNLLGQQNLESVTQKIAELTLDPPSPHPYYATDNFFS